jgi:iron complex outermembrane receptor protein
MSDYLRRAAAGVLSSAALVSHYATAQESNAGSPPVQTGVDTVIVVGSEMTRRGEVAELAVTPGGADLVDVARLEEQNVASLADLLRYSPGVWAVSHNGSDGIFFSSRGSNLDATDYDMNGIKLMQDGLPVTAADGNNHNRIIDPLAASYAVVARGANALKYGASTLGGAVNFASPTARDLPPIELSMRAGSHGEQLTRATFGTTGASFDGLLTLENKRWDGYRDHNEQHRSGLYANAGWQPAPRIATRFYATVLDNDQELPGSLTRAQVDADPDQANRSALTGNFQLNVDTWRVANKTTFQLDANRELTFGFSFEEQSLYHPIVDVRIDFDGPTGPAPEVQVFSLLVDTDHRDVGGVVRYNQRIGDHDVLVGVNYGENETTGGDYENLNGTPNGLMTLIDNDADSLELFAMDRWRLDERVLLILAAQGVSADRNVRNTDAASGVLSNLHDDYSRINPQLGLIYDVTADFVFFANLSQLFEPPTNFQLQDNVRDEVLDAMHGTVAEVGIRGDVQAGRAGDWSWSASAYHAQIEDEILSVEDPSAPGTSLVTNVDETIHAGIEATVSSRIGVGEGAFLEPFVSLTLNDFSFDDDPTYGDADLPAAPEYVLRAEVMYRSPSGFHVGPTLDIVGDRFADFANTYSVDSYALYGLRAGWGNAKWRVFADLRNLGDEDYIASHGVRDVASSDDAILNPGEPRSLYVGFQGRFE